MPKKKPAFDADLTPATPDDDAVTADLRVPEAIDFSATPGRTGLPICAACGSETTGTCPTCGLVSA